MIMRMSVPDIELQINTGKMIKQRREELGISQEELAKRLGYADRSSVAKIETGRRNLCQSEISAIAKALGMNEVALVKGNQEEYERVEEKIVDGFYIQLSPDERLLVETYRNADQPSRLKAYAILDKGKMDAD